MASLEDWLAALEEAAAQQPKLVSKASVLRLDVGGKAWRIACDPSNSAAPVSVTALVDEPTDAKYDFQLGYESLEVWQSVQTGDANPRALMKEGKMTMVGGFKVMMGMRPLMQAAAALANGGEYAVQVTGTGGRSPGGRSPGAGGGAMCCSAPRAGGKVPLGEFVLRVERKADGAVGEGVRSAAEFQQLQASCDAAAAAAGAPLSAVAIERGVAQLLLQASDPEASPGCAAVWIFVRLPPPAAAATAGDSVSEERVAAAEAEVAALRSQLAEVESLVQRRESPMYSLLAAFGMTWVIVPLGALACRAAAAHAGALLDVTTHKQSRHNAIIRDISDRLLVFPQGTAPSFPIPGAVSTLTRSQPRLDFQGWH